MNFKDGVIFGSVLACGMIFGSTAFACSTDGWNGGVIGLDTTLFVGSPVGTSPAFPRYSEFCAMQVTGDGSVRDLSPDHDRIRARFYVLSNLSGTGNAVLFRAYADETDTTTLFEIRRNDGNLVFDTSAAGGASTSVASPGGWVAIEFDWDSVGGTMNFWVNADPSGAVTGSVASGSGTVSSARLGLVGGLGGFSGNAIFDAYEAHSTTPVGLLLVGDANGNGTVNSTDVSAVLIETEIGGALAPGQPDCNANGVVNSTDVSCVLILTEL
ncbi:MAG TPA: hypothetical protein VKN35_13925 [Xanthomonadales bacterium]|nr:hypothetical protein [Xanthomonadales bacterium]